ncbi:MAG: glycine zipper domain-containing protein [Planctomycetota bacterium]
MKQPQLIQRAAVCGILLTGVTLGGCTKEWGAGGGAVLGGVLGAVIGHQIDDDNGAAIGALIGAGLGGVAGYYIGDHIEKKRAADEAEKQAAAERYADMRETFTEDGVEKLEDPNDGLRKGVLVPLDEGSDEYVIVDPVTGESGDDVYEISEEDLDVMMQQQDDGQVLAYDDYDALLLPAQLEPTT